MKTNLMNKQDFLNNLAVNTVIDFIVHNWNIECANNSNRYNKINEAYEQYTWNGQNFQDTEDELTRYSNRIREAFHNNNLEALFDVSVDILSWGGVLGSTRDDRRRKGNYDTLLAIRGTLHVEYQIVTDLWRNLNEENANLICEGITFKSNAGFTKIYSLLLDDFIIYDNRVAVAFTKLICAALNDEIPEELRLNIPLGRNNNVVNQNPFIFKPTYNRDEKHFCSNVKASWILQGVLNTLNETNPVLTIRDLEAALFMFGVN